jgi:hypothetical protein
MWSSSAHMVQAHRGRIESTRIASPSTALAPLTCPLPQASRLHHVIPQKVFTLSHTPHPRVTQHLGIDIGDAYGVRYQRCSTRGTFCSIRNLPGRAWFRQGFRSTSAAVPTTPTSNNNACQFPLFPPNPRGYISRYQSYVQSSTAVGSRLSLTFQKQEGVEGKTGLRTANGVEIPMREGRRRINFFSC